MSEGAVVSDVDGTGHQWVADISCLSDHTSLNECTVTFGTNLDKDCSHSNDVGVKCFRSAYLDMCGNSDTNAIFRLVDPGGNTVAGGTREPECTGSVQGRLEILTSAHQSQMWGSICGGHSLTGFALMACFELGLAGGTKISKEQTEDGSGMGWKIDTGISSCGLGAVLSECVDTSRETPECDHSRDIGVEC